MKFTFDNLFSPQLKIPIWVSSIIVNSKANFSFTVKIQQKNYSITKKDKALLIEYQISGCTDLLYFSYLFLIQTKVNLLKGDEMNICTIGASKYFKVSQIIIYSFFTILIIFSVISFDFNMFFDHLFFLILVGFVLTICLYFIIKLKYKIVKDDLEIIIDDCRSKIANNH